MKQVICLFIIIGVSLQAKAQKDKENMQDELFLGLRTVVYKVDNLKKATEWYAKAVGKEPYFENQYYVGFNVGGYELGLEPVESGSIEVGTNEVTYWGVEDVQESYQRLLDLGAEPHEEP